jgi:hypothetical protein
MMLCETPQCVAVPSTASTSASDRALRNRIDTVIQTIASRNPKTSTSSSSPFASVASNNSLCDDKQK